MDPTIEATTAKTEAEKMVQDLDPEAVNRMAREIENVSKAAHALLNSRLKRDTLALLISRNTWRPKVDQRTVLRVLEAAAGLARANVVPEPAEPKK